MISTPAKSGTTWMQGIVASLLAWDEDISTGLLSRTAWPDFRLQPAAAITVEVEAMEHRRQLKTHSPADCIPIADQEVAYVSVYRNGPDAFASWINHRARMRPEVLATLNQEAALDGYTPWPVFDGDVGGLFEEWSRDCNPVEHLASWWPLRDRPNVLLVHYSDLTADLAGEMRRVAAHLRCRVSEDRWSTVVDRCRLGAMRSSEAAGGWDKVFEGGANSFFHKGGNGRGEKVIDPELKESYEGMISMLSPDAAAWLAGGTHGTGIRPGDE